MRWGGLALLPCAAPQALKPRFPYHLQGKASQQRGDGCGFRSLYQIFLYEIPITLYHPCFEAFCDRLRPSALGRLAARRCEMRLTILFLPRASQCRLDKEWRA